MKKTIFVVIACGSLLAGCGKKEEPAPAPAPKAGAVPVEPKEVVVQKPAMQTPAIAPAAPPLVVPSAPPVVVQPSAPTPGNIEMARRLGLAQVPAAPSVAANAPPPPPVVAAPKASAPTVADLSTDQLTRGLKEALAVGLKNAIAQLGKDGGFATNLSVKIPMPDQLVQVEKALRKIGQDKTADQFVATMNQAAEQAVPAGASVFADAVKQMSIADAKSILQGADDAATQFLRHATADSLTAKFKPIVQQATDKTGVTAAYKQLMDQARPVTAFIKIAAVDLDAYVTEKALDGLFKMVAVEEKKIRENPAARTTEVLKSVFSLFKK